MKKGIGNEVKRKEKRSGEEDMHDYIYCRQKD